MRSNLPIKNQGSYFSAQFGLKYRLNKRQSFLLSGGKYHNYSIPNYFAKSYDLQSSYQMALDYSYAQKNTLITAAIFFKNETEQASEFEYFNIDKEDTFGVEIYFEHNFYRHFKFTFSNSFLDQKVRILGNDYPGSNDFNYLAKATIQYNNPRVFTLALSYIGRPGTHYNTITSAVFNEQTNFYEPLISDPLYDRQFESYNRFDLSLNKHIRLKKNALTTFISLNNLLNAQNERSSLYNSNYTEKDFDYFQFRTVFFGCVWHLN